MLPYLRGSSKFTCFHYEFFCYSIIELMETQPVSNMSFYYWEETHTNVGRACKLCVNNLISVLPVGNVWVLPWLTLWEAILFVLSVSVLWPARNSMAVACYYSPAICPQSHCWTGPHPSAEASVSDAWVKASGVLTGTCHINLFQCYYSNLVCLAEIPVWLLHDCVPASKNENNNSVFFGHEWQQCSEVGPT